jgi:hypothetical protein
MTSSMHHIRPYKLFNLVEGTPLERAVTIPIPRHRGMGGTSLLETILILATIRVVNARRLFEFGTFLGINTLNMALNMRTDAEIFTLDLGEEHAASVKQVAADAELTKIHLASQSSLAFVGTPVAGKINTLFGDSTSFDFSPFHASMDFSFIDGGHDLLTVKSDTENAFKMAVQDSPSAVMWHDYRNDEYPELTRYLDVLAEEQEIFHVEDTMLCVWFNDNNGSVNMKLRT